MEAEEGQGKRQANRSEDSDEEEKKRQTKRSRTIAQVLGTLMENTQRFLHPDEPPKVHVNCFEAQGIVVPNFYAPSKASESSQAPGEGDITLAENHGEMIVMTGDMSDKSLENYTNSHGVLYPHLIVPEENSDNFKPLTLAQPSWYDALRNICSLTNMLNGIYSLIQNPDLFYNLPPSLKISEQTRVRAFAWHKYKQKFAFAYQNNKVGFYHLPSESLSPSPLNHEFLKDVMCMEWRPNVGSEIAIGCKYGICIWQNFPKKMNAAKEESDKMIHDYWWLDYRAVTNFCPINTLCWSPCGGFLAVGSVNSTSILVWNVNYNSYKEHHVGTPVTALAWSPNGYYLFAGGMTKCQVFETFSWGSQAWTFSSACHSVCWSGESSYLAVAFVDKPSIYFLQFHHIPPLIDAQFIHNTPLDPYTVTQEGRTFTVGGNLKELVWDASSHRLAASFQDSPLIALFSTTCAPNLLVYPLYAPTD